MKKCIAAALIAAIIPFSAAQAHEPMSQAERLKSELSDIGAEAFTRPDFKPATIRHIVLFRYKDGITAHQREEVRRRFTALASGARRDGKPYIVSIETGAQSSGEGADGGFQDAFIVTFRSEGDRNYYVGTPIVTDPDFLDPEHASFKAFVGPFLAEKGVLVFDFAVASAD